jgi:predicted nucleotidyltransferase
MVRGAVGDVPVRLKEPSVTVSWAITQEKIDAALSRIVAVARPRRIILFGSVVRGEASINSDLDVLVVTDCDVESPLKESARIRRELRGISMPMDILVIPEARLNELSDKPGLIYREILRSGKVVYVSDG